MSLILNNWVQAEFSLRSAARVLFHKAITLPLLRKLAHAIYGEFFSETKIENFIGFVFNIFNVFAQDIHCWYTLEPPRRGGSNEYPQCMFWIKNKKIRYTPANPSFSI